MERQGSIVTDESLIAAKLEESQEALKGQLSRRQSNQKLDQEAITRNEITKRPSNGRVVLSKSPASKNTDLDEGRKQSENNDSARKKAIEKPSTVDDFVMMEKLGDGAYSKVYKVQRIADKQIYAMKKVRIG
jgi:hypothetical protein